MNCNNYIPLLSAHLDGANSEIEERRLQEHLRTCKHCRELLAQMERADDALKDSAAAPPPDLTEKIMAQVRAEPKKKRRYFFPAAAALATAAMLTLVFSGKIPVLDRENAAPPVSTEVVDAAQTGDGQAPSSPEQSVYGATDTEIASEPTETVKPTETAETTESTVPPSESPKESEPSSEPTEPPTEVETEGTTMDTTVGTTVEPTQTSEPYRPTEPTEPTEPDEGSSSLPTFAVTPGNANPLSVPYFYEDGAIRTEAPMLILWDADPSELEPLRGQEPIEFSEEDAGIHAPSQGKKDETLFEKLLSAMPLKKKPVGSLLPVSSLPSLSVYSLPYETLSELFESCLGSYELAVYYPDTLNEADNCLILLVSTLSASSKS